MPLEYGRAPQGQRVKDISPKGKKERVSCISAISLSQTNTMATQSLVIEGSVNQHAFLGYLEHVLLPTIGRGSVIILDNWTIHYGDDVRELVADFGCELLYLPTYSPDLNPIENLFAKVKTFVKKAKAQNIPELMQAFCDAICKVTFTNILNSFRSCGYRIPKGL